MKIFTLLAICLLGGAWTANPKLSDKVNGDGSGNHPLEEKDSGYLFCESAEDAQRAAKRQVEWKLSNSDDYCRYVHGDKDDTWKSGWEKSRLIRGCKWQMQAFGSKVYRCYDRAKDPAILALDKKLIEQRDTMFREWASSYQEKASELTLGVSQTYGDITVSLQHAKENAAKASSQKQAQEAAIAAANRMIEEAFDRRPNLPNLIADLIKRFDSELGVFNAETEKLTDSLASFPSRLTSKKKVLQDTEITTRTIQEFTSSWRTEDEKFLNDHCRENNRDQILASLRKYIGFASSQVGFLTDEIEILSLPAGTEFLKEAALRKVSGLRYMLDDRSFIFDDHFELLTAKTPACFDLDRVNRALEIKEQILIKIDNAKKTVGVISDFEKAIAILDTDVRDAAAKQCTAIQMTGIKAKLHTSISSGAVSSAMELAGDPDEIHKKVHTRCVMEGISESASVSIQKLISDTKAEILAASTTRLSLPASHAMLSTRLKRIKTKLLQIDLHERAKPDNYGLWSELKVQIYGSLGTTPGKEIPRPHFADFEALLEYDRLLARTESELDLILAGAVHE